MRKLWIIFNVGLSNGRWNERFAQYAAPTVRSRLEGARSYQIIGLKKGEKVADIVAGRLTASLAQAVGRSGKV